MTLTHYPSVTHLPKSHQEGGGQGSCPCSLRASPHASSLEARLLSAPRWPLGGPHAGHSAGRGRRGRACAQTAPPRPAPSSPCGVPHPPPRPLYLSLCLAVPLSTSFSVCLPLPPSSTSPSAHLPPSPRPVLGQGAPTPAGADGIGLRRPLDSRGAGLWPAPEGTWDSGAAGTQVQLARGPLDSANASGGPPLMHCTKPLPCD